ncbi:MAG: glycosyltransferase [Pseudomonadota bacterium]
MIVSAVSGRVQGIHDFETLRINVKSLMILVLTTSFPSDEKDWSGIFIAKLLQAMSRRGHRAVVVAPSDGAFHGRRVVHGIDTVRFGYFVPRSLERLTKGGGGIPENLSKSLLAKLQVIPMMAAFTAAAFRCARDADVVYANWIGAGVVGAVVNTLTGIPLVVSFRGDDGYLARDRFIWRMFTRWVIRRSSVVAPVSAELKEIMRTLGTPESKLEMPRFGVDTDMFRPGDTSREDGQDVRLLYVGALVPKKGLQTLFEALKEAEFLNVRLTVVGEGYYAPELKIICTNVGLDERTRWTGSLPPADVAEMMQNSDILCLPSFTEGSPNVIKEAMATGLAVLATNVGGIPDLVKHGTTGLLFEPGDVTGLRECLALLVRDRDLRVSMGAAGLQSLRTAGLNWDATAEDFDRIFSAAVSRT